MIIEPIEQIDNDMEVTPEQLTLVIQLSKH